MKLNEEISRIKNIMGVLNEQSSSTLIPAEGYDIIKNIEKNFSYTNKKGDIIGVDYAGNDKEENIKKAIEETIGLSYWNKISDPLKIQIYSFMFQSDSGPNSKLRWIAGLAQAIDNSIDRSSIVGKPLDSPKVINAINTIKNSIDNNTINQSYNNYINVLKSQYNNLSGTPNDEANKLKIWGPRPEAIDKLINGESWDDVKKWWISKINTDQSNVSNNPSTPENKITSNQSPENPNKPTQQSSVKPNETYEHNYKPNQVWMGTNNKTNKEYMFFIHSVSNNKINVISYNPRTERYTILYLDVTKPGIFGYDSENGDFNNLKQIK